MQAANNRAVHTYIGHHATAHTHKVQGQMKSSRVDTGGVQLDLCDLLWCMMSQKFAFLRLRFASFRRYVDFICCGFSFFSPRDWLVLSFVIFLLFSVVILFVCLFISFFALSLFRFPASRFCFPPSWYCFRPSQLAIFRHYFTLFHRCVDFNTKNWNNPTLCYGSRVSYAESVGFPVRTTRAPRCSAAVSCDAQKDTYNIRWHILILDFHSYIIFNDIYNFIQYNTKSKIIIL